MRSFWGPRSPPALRARRPIPVDPAGQPDGAIARADGGTAQPATRIINLSSGSALGAAAFRHALLDEETPCEPVSLYAITKYASERVAARLSDVVAIRHHFSAAERRVRAVGARHRRARYVEPADADRRGLARAKSGDSGAAGRAGLDLRARCRRCRDGADRGRQDQEHGLYNISTGREWTALQWGEHLAALHPGFVCRLAAAAKRRPSICTAMPIARRYRQRGWRRNSAGAPAMAARTPLPI